MIGLALGLFIGALIGGLAIKITYQQAIINRMQELSAKDRRYDDR